MKPHEPVAAGIEVRDLTRTFKVPVDDRKGLGRAVRLLLRPDYKLVTALEGISFDVAPGECVGYIGPNGAGKSTTLKILTGILTPSSGVVRVAGHTPWRERMTYTRQIGCVFGQKSLLLTELPVRDTFRLYQSVYGIDDMAYRARLSDLVDRFDVAHLLPVPARKLSLGQRMRCDLIAALLHQPSILFLDEPTIGLDFPGRTQFRSLLTSLHRDCGMTVILTSHDLGEVEAVARRIVVIANGRIAYDGSIAALRCDDAHVKVVEIAFETVRDSASYAALQQEILPTAATAHSVAFALRATDIAMVLSRLVACLDVRDVKITETPLETLVSRWYAA